VAIEWGSPADQTVLQTEANSLPIIASNNHSQVVTHDVETPPQASPVNFDSAIPEIFPFVTSFDLDDLIGSKITTPRIDISSLTDNRPTLREDESSAVVAPEVSTPLRRGSRSPTPTLDVGIQAKRTAKSTNGTVRTEVLVPTHMHAPDRMSEIAIVGRPIDERQRGSPSCRSYKQSFHITLKSRRRRMTSEAGLAHNANYLLVAVQQLLTELKEQS
jgi:hypothetical protein